MPSRWADTVEDAAHDARKKAEKEEKKRIKAEKQRKAEELKRKAGDGEDGNDGQQNGSAKRQRMSPTQDEPQPRPLLRFAAPSWRPCRSIEQFETLNKIEEGSYGYVSRAKEVVTGDIVAIKKLKLNPLADGGFPVTALREIQCLNAAKHRNIVSLREVVTGKEDVYLVMDFVEHDLKTLQDDMQEPFLPSEIKTLLLQLSSAIAFLHDHWILHRDLKTSNILVNNRGEVKIADFGMARFCGDPAPRNLTRLVVTLWYRAPELLLGTPEYDTAIDMWSLGCIFGELLTSTPLLPGKNEVDQLTKIFELCGIPDQKSWPNFNQLPNARAMRLPSDSRGPKGTSIRRKFSNLTNAGADLLESLLALNPSRRPSANAVAGHSYFAEEPRPKPSELFPTFPSRAGQEKRRRQASPHAPVRGEAPALQGSIDLSSIFQGRDDEEKGAGFQLKLG